MSDDIHKSCDSRIMALESALSMAEDERNRSWAETNALALALQQIFNLVTPRIFATPNEVPALVEAELAQLREEMDEIKREASQQIVWIGETMKDGRDRAQRILADIHHTLYPFEGTIPDHALNNVDYTALPQAVTEIHAENERLRSMVDTPTDIYLDNLEIAFERDDPPNWEWVWTVVNRVLAESDPSTAQAENERLRAEIDKWRDLAWKASSDADRLRAVVDAATAHRTVMRTRVEKANAEFPNWEEQCELAAEAQRRRTTLDAAIDALDQQEAT